jgi:putative chitinase
LQLTGRYNYQRFSDGIGDPRVMEGVEYVSTTYPFMSAKTWIEENNLLQIAQTKGFDDVCYRINGGWTGYEDRLAKYQICKDVL